MSKQALVSPEHGNIQPATAGDIVYRAYGRPYAGGPGQVLNLFASCSYATGGWKIFFAGDGPGHYKLMEQAPGVAPQLITYYVADFTTGAGLASPVESIVVTDANGRHEVPVESLD